MKPVYCDESVWMPVAKELTQSGILYVNQYNRRIGKIVKKVDACLQENPQTKKSTTSKNLAGKNPEL